MRLIIPIFAALFLLGSVALAGDTDHLPNYRWIKKAAIQSTLLERIAPPEGYTRVPATKKSFAYWLRHLPLKPVGARVMLYDGAVKGNQEVHGAVFDIDVGSKDRQQCADAVMRLRAEYLYSAGRAHAVCFNRVSGKKMCFKDYKKIGFRRYLSNVFAYANTRSLFHQMKKVQGNNELQAGHVFIEPANSGMYGHAVIVLDVATNKQGEKLFLIGQSYMPAQDIHLLKNTREPALGTWFRIPTGEFQTPEWTFPAGSLRHF